MNLKQVKLKEKLLTKNMVEETKLVPSLNENSLKREKRILKQLNLKKLPFKTSAGNFCDIYISLIQDLRETFQYQSGNPGMIWCLSTIKKFKVFLLIFEANEIGTEIYKENISNRLPEYSYKTVAQIVDEGIVKGFFIKLEPRVQKTKDLKIRNIRPSESLTVEFLNWNIDIISSITKFVTKYK